MPSAPRSQRVRKEAGENEAGREGTRPCWVLLISRWGRGGEGGGMSSGRTHRERHSSLKAWIAMRVIFTDIKQKGNCWKGSGTTSVATQVLPSVFPVFRNPAWPADNSNSPSPEAVAMLWLLPLNFHRDLPISQMRLKLREIPQGSGTRIPTGLIHSKVVCITPGNVLPLLQHPNP